jgi:predicted enzyme related to lactoylglutathione lyase
MTTRDKPFAPGTPCWVDLLSSDIDASNAFYAGLFGWDAETSGEEFGRYVVYSSGGHPVAGAMPNRPEIQSPDVWSTYIATADCAATVASATAAGGQVMMDTMAVGENGEVGTVAMLIDPSGAAVGLWESGQHTGFGKYNEPGSVTWDEHHSKDFAASTAFYQKVFGWEFEVAGDTDEFRYSIAKVDGESVAGLMDSTSFLPAEVPSHWKAYFSVESADDAVAKVQELGGSVTQAAADTPYGRIAMVADPTGAQFSLHQELPQADS